MDLTVFRTLLSPPGQEVLQAAMDLQPREADFLRHFTALSRKFPAELARAALETAILRGEASIKFPAAERMYFTRPALEQASAYLVAGYRAGRYDGFNLVADLGCSIGGDSLALAVAAPVLGLDIDPLRLAMAQANLEALRLADHNGFCQADLVEPLPLPDNQGIGLFFDPARRTSEKRLFSVRDYRPPFPIVQEWLPRFPALGVKISPGVKLVELQGYDAEVEFISVQGELKEAVLWFGPLKTAHRRATLLPGKFTMERVGSAEACLPLSEPQSVIYEPDPAVLRAGLVADLGTMLDACQLDPDIAYLTASEHRSTPFARAWRVEAWFPFQLKRLRSELRARRVGRVTIKKRGSPLEPEALIRELRLIGDRECVVFLTHLRGRPIAILSAPWKPAPAA